MKRQKISFSEDGSSENVVESKALPAIEMHKKMILLSKLRLHYSRKVLLRNKKTLGGFQRQDIAEFQSCIVDLFYYVNDMMDEKISELKDRKKLVEYKRHLELYEKVLKLERGVEYPVFVMIDLARYVNSYLHWINITNLLRVDPDALSVLESQY